MARPMGTEMNDPRPKNTKGCSSAGSPHSGPLLLLLFLAGSGAGVFLLQPQVCATRYNGPVPVSGGESSPGAATTQFEGPDRSSAVQAPLDAPGKFPDAQLVAQLAEYADDVSTLEAKSPAPRRPPLRWACPLAANAFNTSALRTL